MTTISAEIICDSIGKDAPRLTTMHLRYPRCIHSEFMTHRQFSRNAGSSRAKPIERQIQEIMDDSFIPLHWGAAQAGMQAHNECNNPVLWPHPLGDNLPLQEVDREAAWLYARDEAVKVATAFLKGGYAKQLVNRLLEPFAHIDVVVTATEWENFFGLRYHKDAEPHIQILARAMKSAMENTSVPRVLKPEEWHLPYVQAPDDYAAVDGRLTAFTGLAVHEFDAKTWKLRQDLLCRISAARCARVSYRAYDGSNPNIHADLELAEKLSTSGHWSPFEHQATPDTLRYLAGLPKSAPKQWGCPGLHGNLVGWKQNRKFYSNESGIR